jgi:predicted hydrocarbon binding protein
MHGLIFVTWEKYLAERFGNSLLNEYQYSIGETTATAPLASRVYSDETLLAGVAMASKLTHRSADALLREYGYYFIINGLTSHLCAYLLTKVDNARDLLLMMRMAHNQMHQAQTEIQPPLFQYAALSQDRSQLELIYDSPRQLCSVLYGAIEGAAKRYGERVQITERSCMKRGAPTCRFEVRFSQQTHTSHSEQTPEQNQKRQAQQNLEELLLHILPVQHGQTLGEIQVSLRQRTADPLYTRPHFLLETLQRLTHAGLIASTANQHGDNLTQRRYWRAQTLRV